MPDGAPRASDDGAQEVTTDASPSSSHAVVGEGQTRNSPACDSAGIACAGSSFCLICSSTKKE